MRRFRAQSILRSAERCAGLRQPERYENEVYRFKTLPQARLTVQIMADIRDKRNETVFGF